MALERRMELVRVVLSRLEHQPFRWTPLLKATIPICGSPPRLYYILKYLHKNGFVENIAIMQKSHWAITEKGRQLLKALSRPESDLRCHISDT